MNRQVSVWITLLVCLFLVSGCSTQTVQPASPAASSTVAATLPPVITTTIELTGAAPSLAAPTANPTATLAPSATEAPATATLAPTATAAPPTTAPPTATTAATPAPTPRRVRFAAGATSIVLNGNLAANGVHRYVLAVQANQVIEISLGSVQGVALSVIGADGSALQSVIGGPAGLRGVFPKAQDYIVEVGAGNAAVAYTMQIIIPQRIQFAAGATSALLSGRLAARGSHHYVVRAQANQLLDVGLISGTSLQLVIYGYDGTVLKSGMGEGSQFRGLLPSTQDYILVASAPLSAASYSINVIIPQRIQFAAGATSGTVRGDLPAESNQYYVLRAQAGQTMRVTLTPGEGLQLAVYGVDGNVLQSGMGSMSGFEGVLPSTQDYILVVTSSVRRVAYTLEVAIP